MAEGYISLYRSLLNNWLWEEGRVFSRAEAWIDILLMVNFAEGTHKIGDEVLPVHPGSRYVTIRELCQRWQWSNTKVTKFMRLLETEKMIVQNNDKKKTLITVVNWAKYQVQDDKKTSEKRQENDNKTSLNNNVNNENKEINNNYPDLEQEVFLYWNQKGIVNHPKMTNNLRIALNRAVKIHSIENIKSAIDHYAIMYNDQTYEYCQYKWTLEKFLDDAKGVAFFMDDGQKWLSYSTHSRKIESQKPKNTDNFDPFEVKRSWE